MIRVPTFTGMGECVSIKFLKKDAVVNTTLCSNLNGVIFISRAIQTHAWRTPIYFNGDAWND